MINSDYFIYLIGIIFLIIASIQDLKKKEVSNYIPLSLIIIGFFYNLLFSNFLYSIFSFGLMIVIGYFLYYFGIFGGGDAKLLMSLGVIINGSNLKEVFFNDLMFIGILFLVGSIWNIFASFKWKILKKGRPFVPAFFFAFLIFIYLIIKKITILTLVN